MTCTNDTFEIGETIRIEAITTNCSDVRVSANTITVQINSPTGTVLIADTVHMTLLAVGSYYYDYLIPGVTGTYSYKIEVSGATGRITKEKGTFMVVSEI